MQKGNAAVAKLILVFFSLAILLFLILLFRSGFQHAIYTIIIFISLFLTIQAIITLCGMLYFWNSPDKARHHSSPQTFLQPKLSFTAIIPARDEKKVIGSTIQSIAQMNYPERLKEVLIVCRVDDLETISEVNKTINHLEKNNIKLITFDSYPINKPHALNIALQQASHEVITIFDAEDEPHKDLYNIINTSMQQHRADVIQSGVQLMNYHSRWFSLLNVLEYFFWFKSTLPLFAKVGIIPLGGNTVFFRKKILESIGGWDKTCLTEDADIGIRLSASKANIHIVYDEKYTTKEESPLRLSSFIKQRTRWNQGFLQILTKGHWLDLQLIQVLLAAYILLVPELQAILFLYAPFSLFLMIFFKLPLGIAMLSILPFYVLLLQFITYNIGFYLFTKQYNEKYSPRYILKILYTYLPYQFILGSCALRATFRMITKEDSWEKTNHANAHRISSLQLAK